MRFNNNGLYNAAGSKLPVGEFHNILKQLYVSKIDYDFLTAFYIDPSR